jgi:hypothetical protein
MAEYMIAFGQYLTLFSDESPERRDYPLTIKINIALVSFFEPVQSGHLQCANLLSEKPFLDDSEWSLRYRSKMMRFLRR